MTMYFQNVLSEGGNLRPSDLTLRKRFTMTTDGDQQAEEEDVGRIDSFRLEEAFLAACKDGNLPVVRFCLENR